MRQSFVTRIFKRPAMSLSAAESTLLLTLDLVMTRRKLCVPAQPVHFYGQQEPNTALTYLLTKR